jgi:hypothetical protein
MIPKTGQQQFIEYVEYDREDNPVAIIGFNRHQVVSAAYSVVRHALIITLTSQTGEAYMEDTRPGEVQDTVDGEGKPIRIQPVYHGINSNIKNDSLHITRERDIVQVFNWLFNTDHTVKNFPGFLYRKQQETKLQEAIEKKRLQEEEQGKQQREAAIMNPHLNTPDGGKVITPSFKP